MSEFYLLLIWWGGVGDISSYTGISEIILPFKGIWFNVM